MVIMKKEKTYTEYIKPTCNYFVFNTKAVIATSTGYTNSSLGSETDDFLI